MPKKKGPEKLEDKKLDPKDFTFDQRRFYVSKMLIDCTPNGSSFERLGILEAIRAELQAGIAKIIQAEMK